MLLFGICRLHGDEWRGRRAAEKLIGLDPQNSSPHVLLANIYAASGNWNEVNSLRMTMKEKGFVKLLGCSWILVGQKHICLWLWIGLITMLVKLVAVLEYLLKVTKEGGYVVDMDHFLHDDEGGRPMPKAIW
ncbi:hypothetical protein TorRG33x02_157830 [Trema orientale]|uniref:Pentatricopeptide repeat n=1 Tax=Trema orientale TaxID=63057 RepID=A0A2P5ES93_TREOI|nr:hypothetical protein TorRG33x02_157830 [Trema orientale]